MSRRSQEVTKASAGDEQGQKQEPRSLAIAEDGIKSSRDFRDFMSALMSDTVSGRLSPGMTNAACNAGGKLLKMVDLEYKYGTNPERKHRTLSVAFELDEGKQIESIEQRQLKSGD